MTITCAVHDYQQHNRPFRAYPKPLRDLCFRRMLHADRFQYTTFYYFFDPEYDQMDVLDVFG
jgi:hypothetical protein